MFATLNSSVANSFHLRQTAQRAARRTERIEKIMKLKDNLAICVFTCVACNLVALFLLASRSAFEAGSFMTTPMPGIFLVLLSMVPFHIGRMIYVRNSDGDTPGVKNHA